jgi:hypothetical protein
MLNPPFLLTWRSLFFCSWCVVRIPIHSCPWFAINCSPLAVRPTPRHSTDQVTYLHRRHQKHQPSLCPTRLGCTSEDDCKWFLTTIWFILLKQIIKLRNCSWLQLLRFNNELMCTMLHTLCMMESWCPVEPVLLFFQLFYGCLLTSAAADWQLILLSTGWAGPPPLPPYSWWPHFPQGPGTPSSPCPIWYKRQIAHSYSASVWMVVVKHTSKLFIYFQVPALRHHH